LQAIAAPGGNPGSFYRLILPVAGAINKSSLPSPRQAGPRHFKRIFRVFPRFHVTLPADDLDKGRSQ
jgi:hypothetical protein